MFAATASGKRELDTTVEFVSSTNKSILSAATDTTITLSGIQADDVVFLAIASRRVSISDITNSGSTLSSGAWTNYEDISSINPHMNLFHTVATGTSVTVDTNYTPSGRPREYVMCLFAFRGLNTSDPTFFIGAENSSSNSIPLTDFTGVGYDTYLLGIGSLAANNNVTFTMPSGYTEIFQGDTNGGRRNTTMAVAYGALYANYASSGKAFSTSSTGGYRSDHIVLVPSGKDGTPPVITGAQVSAQTVGSTSVATYSADETVTWSLEGTDANLLSISSAGVVTYNSATTAASRHYIDVVATNNVGWTTSYPVQLDNYVSGGTAGGGITLVTSDSGDSGDTLTLNGLQSGDLVFFSYASDELLFNTPTGYTQYAPEIGGTEPALRVYYKVTNSSSESLNLPIANGPQKMGGGMFAFRGVDNTNPVITRSSTYAGGGNDLNIPDNFILDDTVELVIGGLDDDSNVSSTQPTGYTEIIEQNADSSGFTAAHLNISYKNVNGNTTETGRQVTFSSGDNFLGYSLTLNPD